MIPDSVSKPDFCFWLVEIDNQLEAIHGLEKPVILLEKIRRM